MKNLIILILICFAANTLHAQQLNLNNGEEFAIELHNTQTNIAKPTIVNEQGYTFQFKMLGSSATGCKLQCTLLKAKTYEKAAYGTTQINSDSLNNLKEFNNSALLIPLMLLQQPFTIVLNPKGKLTQVEGTNELIQQAITRWHLKVSTQQYIKPYLDTFLAALFKGMFFQFPAEKIAFQSTWTNKETSIDYKVVAIHGAVLDIVATGLDKASQEKYALNETNGLIEDAVIIRDQAINNVPEMYKYTQKVIYGKNTDPAIDTAWINMAVTMSYWSDGFNTITKKIDHTKALGYFKAHDAAYQSDRYYTINKLALIKSLDDEMMAMRLYHDILKKTDNSILSGYTFPLFDKLQMLENADADAAFDVIKYLYKSSDLDEWLQLYSRNFLEERNTVICTLLELLNADKTMHLQPRVNALSLWVNAKDNATDPQSLLRSYNGFMRMSDEYIQQGNGTRYALLTYKLLVKKNRPKEADKLLQKITENLERYTGYTLNKRRFADNDILTYAYYLKYQALNKTDSVKALQYLAKAAYMPVNKSRKSISDLSDRLFLESKDNYRNEYIDKLFAHGDGHAALKLFVEHINADPGKLDDMEKIYQARFKGKSFKDFFISNILTSWQSAPDFTLAGLNGEMHKLGDYKGKWLVIDFWGTWCAPCREEMPVINKYNNEIVDGKHAGVNLLSIACNDNIMEVKKYLKENKFGITAAMGDNVIPVKYKLKQYPSKILVSPNGKMIDIPPRADWQAVVRKLNELYTAH